MPTYAYILPMDEVNRLSSSRAQRLIRQRVLAYEVTKLVHGEEKAKKALGALVRYLQAVAPMVTMPSVELDKASLKVKRFRPS